jgi:DNA-directed RNA polymerase subunit RPC12/RpoP
MRRRFTFGPLPPKGPPHGSVTPDTLTADGLVVCPACGGRCRTPTAWNPFNGRDEPMILVALKTNRCPHCEIVHFVSPRLAREFNHRLFPDDPQYFPEEGE